MEIQPDAFCREVFCRWLDYRAAQRAGTELLLWRIAHSPMEISARLRSSDFCCPDLFNFG